ncbi:lipoprotein [Sutterella sp.]|uniref:LPS translocon maturation chaperone LptM n=1 Tax=Sutterella sp. TaxID=1981025 RepID=UPI0026E07460|nr:lipoprotein [Sutterella sp.]MDO5531271.1 lipoprotein [Sutterella sp.]
MKKFLCAGLAGIAAVMCLGLSGCGLKGPLYMPDEPAPVSAPQQTSGAGNAQ